MRCCEKSGDRTSSTRGGAGDGHARAQRAPRPAGRPHERIGVPIRPAAGSRSHVARSHRRVGAPPPAVRRKHDLPEAAPGGPTGQSQACRSTLRGGAAAGPSSAPQEGAPRRPAAARPTAGAERGVVRRLRLRSHGRRPSAEVPDDRRRRDHGGGGCRTRARAAACPSPASWRRSPSRAACPRCCARTTGWSSAGAPC